MNIRISLGMAIAIMLMLGAVIFSITRDYTAKEYTQKINDLRAREATQAKYAEIDREVRDAYYGAGAIDESQLLDAVARGYIQGIGDPYANYIDARTNARLQRSEENQLADIGALIEANPEGDGYLTIREVYPDSPALRADLMEGDLIVRVDEEDLTPENSEEMLEAISGEHGSRITLTVRRGSTDTTITLQRRIVAAPTVYAQMLDDGVGYIRIKDFEDITTTVEQFKRELNTLTGAGARSIIFDVRDNPGTRIGAATRVLDRLLPSGIIASQERRDGDQMVVSVLATSDATELDLPMVVLVNGGTASGAELFAQALKDYDRARIVGVNTAGNGVVLDTINLSDGSAIQITVGKLVPPGGEQFDGVGIRPDYEVTLEDPWEDLNLEMLLDTQLKKAHEVALSMQRSSGGDPVEPEVSEPDSSEPETPAGDGEGGADPDAGDGEGDTGGDGDPEDDGEGDDPEADSSADDGGTSEPDGGDSETDPDE